ncbi:MAG: hypothetical protein ABL998_14800 [Planctomycetota bacterium]
MATRTKRDDEDPTGEDEGERAKARPAGRGERDPQTALVEGLEELVPGLSVLDRELVFEGGARADLAAADPSGRLWLVQLAGEDVDRAALEVLDLLAVLARELALVVRHLASERVQAERAPRIVVVSPNSDARLAARLAPLAAAGVEVVGLRAVKSQSGERAYLVRLEADGRPAVSASGVGAFLRALSARHEPLVRSLLERMARLDEELAVSGDANVLLWRLAGEVLARVERSGDALQASVAPRHEPLALADAADAEGFVERALARLVRVLGMVRPEGAVEVVPRGARTDEPLLTAEEIQAFRE